MKAKKAIKKIKAMIKGCGPEMQEYKDAMQLGIEALKAIDAWRHDLISSIPFQLPGETPEEEGE